MDDHMCIASNSIATRKNYIRGVKLLILHYNKLPEHCTTDEVKAFLRFQKESDGIASSTLNVRVASLKLYFRKIVRKLELVVSIPNPRVPKYDTEILNQNEILRLFDACKDCRQLLVLQLFYDCGLRVSEVVALRPSDFNPADRTVRIRNTKGHATRTVYYGHRLRDTLNHYYKSHGLHNDTLIDSYTQPGKPLSKSGLQHIIKQLIRRAGIKKRASCHTLRHTFAVHYLNGGGSIFTLQKLLGHSCITITLDYLKHANIPDGNRISILDILLNT